MNDVKSPMAMAAPPGPSEPPASPDAPKDLLQLKLLGVLRTEVLDLQNFLDCVRKGEADIKTYSGYITKTKKDIDDLIGQLQDGSSARHIKNIWEQAGFCPLLMTPHNDFQAQQQLHHLTMLDRQIQNLLKEIGRLTIPVTLNDWLAKERPGYYVPFHMVFADEIPNAEDRINLLKHLSFTPKIIIDGVIDAPNGLIYRCAKSRGWHWLSIIGILLFYGLVTLAIYKACQLNILGLEPENWPILLTGWGAIVGGMIAHLGIGSVKRMQAQGGLPTVIAVGDIPRIVNAKFGPIMRKWLLAVIAFMAIFATAGIDNVTPFYAFLVGYSLDSFIEVFGANIEQQAAAKVASLKKQMSPASVS
jgi:hypothetical protein